MTDNVTHLRDVYGAPPGPEAVESRRVYAEGISIANQLDRLIEECDSLGEQALACAFRLIMRRLVRREEHGLANTMLLSLEMAAREVQDELGLLKPERLVGPSSEPGRIE
jgi:hypothetical protein